MLDTALLLKVKDQILKQPERFHMGAYVNYDDADCATTHCLAGWAYFFKHDMHMQIDPGSDNQYGERLGAEALGITEAESSVLFYDWRWPLAYSLKYREVGYGDPSIDAEKGARIAADLIDEVVERGIWWAA